MRIKKVFLAFSLFSASPLAYADEPETKPIKIPNTPLLLPDPEDVLSNGSVPLFNVFNKNCTIALAGSGGIEAYCGSKDIQIGVLNDQLLDPYTLAIITPTVNENYHQSLSIRKLSEIGNIKTITGIYCSSQSCDAMGKIGFKKTYGETSVNAFIGASINFDGQHSKGVDLNLSQAVDFGCINQLSIGAALLHSQDTETMISASADCTIKEVPTKLSIYDNNKEGTGIALEIYAFDIGPYMTNKDQTFMIGPYIKYDGDTSIGLTLTIPALTK